MSHILIARTPSTSRSTSHSDEDLSFSDPYRPDSADTIIEEEENGMSPCAPIFLFLVKWKPVDLYESSAIYPGGGKSIASIPNSLFNPVSFSFKYLPLSPRCHRLSLRSST